MSSNVKRRIINTAKNQQIFHEFQGSTINTIKNSIFSSISAYSFQSSSKTIRRAKNIKIKKRFVKKTKIYTLLKYMYPNREENRKYVYLEDILKKKSKKRKLKNRNVLSKYKCLDLSDYIFKPETYLKLADKQHIDRSKSVPSVTYEDFAINYISEEEWIYFQTQTNYYGLFKHLYISNTKEFEYWDKLEDELRNQGFISKVFTIKDIIILEILKHKWGIKYYTCFRDRFNESKKEGLKGVLKNPNNVPHPYHFSYYYKWLKLEHFMEFYDILLKECIEYGIIHGGILMADGLFFRTWAGNFTKDKNGQPTDPEASRTVHDKKYYGKGYTAIIFYAWCKTRWLPLYAQVFTGKVSEKKVLNDVLGDFMDQTTLKWKVFLYDKGGFSKKNRDLIKSYKLISGIPAPKNIKYDNLIDIGRGRYVCESDIPEGISVGKFGKLIDHRAQIESAFSPFTVTNGMKGMNRMGLEAAKIHIMKYLIIKLLEALTAFKVNRLDLIMKSTAFLDLFRDGNN